jgi:hypothetical protein
MDFETEVRARSLRVRIISLIFVITICGIIPSALWGQPPAPALANQLDAMTPSEIGLFVTRVVNEDFAGDVDGFILLAMNRSQIVVPKLLAYLASSVTQAAPESPGWQVAADILAYVADERAIDALAKLCAVDETRFSHFVGRAFDYSQRRMNPYTLAYYSLKMPSQEMNRAVSKWIDRRFMEQDGTSASGLMVDQHLEQLAEAVLARYAGKPTEAQLSTDPIASRLIGQSRNKLRDELLKSARQDVERK